MSLSGGLLDAEKVVKLAPREMGFSWSDVKATLAVISFILRGAVSHDVDAGSFLRFFCDI